MTVAVAVLGLVLGGAGVWLVSRSSAATTGIEPTSSGSASASASSAASRTSSATPRTTESSPSPAWQELEGPTSGPFKGASAAAYRGAIWVAGGMGTVVRVYNPGTRGWGNGPPLPAARRLGVLVAAGRRLYYIGGLTDDDRQGRPTVFYLDSPSGTWREGPRLPEGRYSGAGAWDGRRIVFAGGAAATGAGRRARSDVWALVSGRWTPIQRLPNPREHLAAATDGDGTTWFVGGTDVPSRTMSAEVDEVQGSRVIIVGRLQRRVQGLSALWTAESGVCAIGGSTAQPNVVPTRPVDTVGCLGGHAWPHLPRAMYLPASAILAGKAYVITGHQMFLLHFRS